MNINVTIKRSEWLHGEGASVSYLLRSKDNKMCCLGFLSLACGYSKEEIVSIKTPDTVIELTGKNRYPELIIYQNHILDQLMNINDTFDIDDHEREAQLIDITDLTNKLMEINDSICLTMDDNKREILLTEIFQSIDINVSFID